MPFGLQASSQIKFAEAFNVLAINGKTYQQGLVSQERLISLNAGLNRVIIEYEEVFESDDGEDFDIVKSSPFLVEIYLQDKRSYQQRLLKPADSNAARRFAKSPKFNFVELSTNSQQNFKLTALSGTNEAYLLQESRLPTRKTLIISADKASSPPLKPTKPNNRPKTTPQNSLSKDTESTASKMLEYWWAQATETEREAFLKQIKQ